MGAAIRASQLSPGLLKRLLRGRGEGASVPVIHPHSRTTAWKDIPSSWGTCRPHGMAWYPKEWGCVHCDPSLMLCDL